MKRWLLSVNTRDNYKVNEEEEIKFYTDKYPKEGDIVIIYVSSPLAYISHFFTVKESSINHYHNSSKDRYEFVIHKKFKIPYPIDLQNLKSHKVLDGWISKFREGLYEIQDDTWSKFIELFLDNHSNLFTGYNPIKDQANNNVLKGCRELLEKIKRYSYGESKLYPCICNEANTQSKIIDPLLKCLGWDNSYEICQEYCISRKKVDYALLVNGHFEIFMEVKSFTHELNDEDKIQLEGYCSRKKVKHGVLTNGKNWIFFRFNYLKEFNYYVYEKIELDTINVEDDDVDQIMQKLNNYLGKNSYLA